MREFRTLKLLDKFKKVFTSMGIHYPTLRKILQVKFTLDSRRTTMMSKGQKDASKTNMFYKSLMYYGFFGLFLAVFPFIGHLFIGLSLFYGVIMFFLVTILISDFSEVLLDLKDGVIIGTKPVDEKTMNMAKYIHVVTYLTLIALSLSGPGTIAFGIKYGILVPAIMILQLILICALTVILATLIYALLLKFFDGEKLRDIINIFQIILATVMAVGYQIFARVFRFIDFDMAFNPKWWTFIMPPIWFSSQVDLLLGGSPSKESMILAVFGIVITITAIILHIKVISKVFENNINKLNNASSSNKSVPKWIRVLNHKVMNILNRNTTEKAFYRFAQTMYKHDRGIKLRVYPTIALALLFPPIIAFFSFLDSHSLEGFIQMFSETRMILFIYLTGLMMASIAKMIHYTDSYKGRWVMKVLPIGNYEHVIKGVNKAFVLSFLLPIYLVLSLFVMLFVDIHRIIDLILMAIVSLNSHLLVLKINAKELPFIKPYNHGDVSKGTFFVNMGIMGAFVWVHHIVFYNNTFKMVYLMVHIGILIYAWKTAFKLKTSDLTAIEKL